MQLVTVVLYSDIPNRQYSEFKYIHPSKILSTSHKIAAVKFQKIICDRLERKEIACMAATLTTFFRQARMYKN